MGPQDLGTLDARLDKLEERVDGLRQELEAMQGDVAELGGLLRRRFSGVAPLMGRNPLEAVTAEAAAEDQTAEEIAALRVEVAELREIVERQQCVFMAIAAATGIIERLAS